MTDRAFSITSGYNQIKQKRNTFILLLFLLQL